MTETITVTAVPVSLVTVNSNIMCPARQYPLLYDIRMAHDASLDFVTFMTPLWYANDYVACKVAPGTGDVSPLDDVTFPCIKAATTTVTRSDTAIADIVSEALAHGCEYVFLNYEEAVSAATILGYWEADQPVVVAAGLKCVVIPTLSVLNTLMSNADGAARTLAVTEWIYVQAQSLQDDPPDGSFATDLETYIDLIRTRSATVPIAFQCSTEKPTGAISAANVITQAESVNSLDFNNGGFATWGSAANWDKIQTIIETVAEDIISFDA